MQLRFEKMLSEADENLSFLMNEKKSRHDLIEKGSVIETDKNFLFVGISVPVFDIDGKEVISFSDNAPIYEGFKGKKIGDRVKIGDNSYEIQSIG